MINCYFFVTSIEVMIFQQLMVILPSKSYISWKFVLYFICILLLVIYSYFSSWGKTWISLFVCIILCHQTIFKTWGYVWSQIKAISIVYIVLQLVGKDPDAGKDWRQEKKGTIEDEMVGWHHRLNGHEFEQIPGDGEEQGSLVCCSPWDRKRSTSRLYIVTLLI